MANIEGPVEEQPDNEAQNLRLQVYGTNFPDPAEQDGAKWRAWLDSRVKEQEGIIRDKRLHWARHRHFRAGRQWISQRDGRVWREMDNDKNELRMTLDLIGPTLDFRLGIIDEQRPGFKALPLGFGVRAREMAEAQQRVAEHYYHCLKGQLLMREAAGYAQTDGAAFIRVFVDKNGGPVVKDVRMVEQTDARYADLVAQGYEVDEATQQVVLPMDEEGNIAPVGSEVREYNEGDIGSDVIQAHEVWFDPEANSVNGPHRRAKWAFIMRVRNLQSARIETGDPKLPAESSNIARDPVLDSVDTAVMGSFQRGLPPFPMARQERGETTVEFFLYIAPNKEAGLDKGLWRRIVGNKLMGGSDELPGGKIPLARLSDGSSDSSMFPRPVVSTWVPDQLTINALVTKIVEHVRLWAAGRVISQKGTMVSESFTTITGSLMEYTGAKPELLDAPRLVPDIWSSLQFFVKKLEDKGGWNDLARGRVTGEGSNFEDISGRAILAAGERLERTFGPMIRATADGMSELAVLWVDYCRWLFETPRMLNIVGRGDLAKAIDGKDLGYDSTVYMDPESLMPMPRAVKQQLLFEMLKIGLITAEQFNKRAPYAEVRDINMGDTEQWERAQWINTSLQERWEEMSQAAQSDPMSAFVPEMGGIAVLWQDDVAAHKRALLEIALDERKPLPLKDLALSRWAAYDQLERAKGMPGTATTPPVPPSAPMPVFVRGAPPDLAMMAMNMPLPPQGGGGVPANAQAPGTQAGGAAPEISAAPGEGAALDTLAS